MQISVPTRPALAGFAAAITIMLSGCVGTSGGTSSPAQQAAGGSIDVRQFIGPDYCPELRVREGTEVLRRYQRGQDGDPAAVIWQASIGNTARECLYDTAGNLTIRIGVSGRVIAGPRGGPGPVSAPLRIAVVKYQEAVLSSQLLPLAVTIPAQNSTVFTEVKEVTVRSPGEDRDYIIYVGFDDGQEAPIGNPTPPRPAEEPAAEEMTDSGDLIAY